MMTFFSWSQSVLSLFCLADSLVDICIFMPTDLLADWFQQPYVHVEMESSNLIFLPFLNSLQEKCRSISAWERNFYVSRLCDAVYYLTFNRLYLRNMNHDSKAPD